MSSLWQAEQGERKVEWAEHPGPVSAPQPISQETPSSCSQMGVQAWQEAGTLLLRRPLKKKRSQRKKGCLPCVLTHGVEGTLC